MIDLKQAILKETDCNECFHYLVCHHNKENLCTNYVFGNSVETGCSSCENRFHRDNRPCFHCKEFCLTPFNPKKNLKKL